MTDTILPPFRIETCEANRREPGMMMFNIRPGGNADRKVPVGWLMGVDQKGETAFCQTYEDPPQDVCALPNGNILFSQTGAGLITEMTRTGDTIRRWCATGKWRNKTIPDGTIPIDVELLHHTVRVFPNGNMLLLTIEIRDLPDWPSSDTDPSAPTETARVVGDVVLEVTPAGDIVNKWKILDLLDPYRLCYGSRSPYWVKQGFPDTNDWCHTNAATYDERDDSIIVSLRTQDCLVKFDRANGSLKWILGTHRNWKAPWSDKLLHPIGDIEWQYHQHDCSVTTTGTILCFDNGNFRATPFDRKLPAAENRSRIVEFDVDETAGTVRQVWDFDGSPDNRLYGCYQGGAFRLPKTGNSFATFGGVVTDNGKPSDASGGGFCRSRLVEVTPDGDVVFDMRVDSSDQPDPTPLSVFRAEHIPPL